MMAPLEHLASGLQSGQLTSRALVEACLERALDPHGEGARTFISVDAQAVRAQADAIDAARRSGTEQRPFAGIPISVKDLFDVQGQVTTAGSAVLRGEPAAQQDALAVARLKAAGLLVVGRTNMTEFAYSGLGINPHYGTPANAFDRQVRRIPGGSSSGAAISVTDGMAAAALGSDTGGSCRIPAALNGLVGYKPTASRIPLQGAFALSPSLDSIGPIARSVKCCADLLGVLSATPCSLNTGGPRSLRLALVQTVVLDGLDAQVAQAFSHAVTRLSAAGMRVQERQILPFADLAQANARGGLVAAEAYAAHRERLHRDGAQYDPRVSVRIEKGATQTADEYTFLLEFRRSWMQAVEAAMHDVDFLVGPTVPIIAPAIDALQSEEAYGATNLAMLRNPTFANFMDGCSISLPCHSPGDAPVGLMLMGRHGDDERLLSAAARVESILQKGTAMAR